MLVCYSTLAHAFKHRAQKQLCRAQRLLIRATCINAGLAVTRCPPNADVGSHHDEAAPIARHYDSDD